MKLCKTILISATVLSLLSPAVPVLALEGYKFDLKLTSKDVNRDPDGIWSAQDLLPFGNPPLPPSIYTARLTTPSGEWLLTQTDAGCNMQTMCTALLVLKTADGQSKIVANPQVMLGGSATLSLNYKKITTEELDGAAKPFTGSYEVDPLE